MCDMEHLCAFITLTYGQILKIGQDIIFFKDLNFPNMVSYFENIQLTVDNNSGEKFYSCYY